jgi:SAM-dependent methyltransferase
MKPLKAFSKSAEVYDIVHASKDYAGEAARITRYLRQGCFLPRLIDWGCGTGRFIDRFSRLGFDAVGVEPCEEMFRLAQMNGYKVFQGTLQNPPKQIRGQYENAVCLYGALSYAAVGQWGNEEATLSNALRSVHSHLTRAGRFVFDVVNYACAAKDLREESHEKFGDVERWMSKRFDTHNAIVYHEIRYKHKDEEWVEHHSMRAFTVPEIKYALKDCQFGIIDVISNREDDINDLATPKVTSADYYFTVVAEAL